MIVNIAWRLLVIAFVLVSASAFAAYKVEIKPLTNPFTVGTNKLEIKVFTPSNQPAADVTLKLLLSMPAMGTMPYMEVQGDIISAKSGVFNFEIETPMGGTWDLMATVSKGDTTNVFRYSITTEIPGIVDKNDSTPSTNASSTLLNISPDRLQRIGVRFAKATSGTMEKIIRSTGVLEADVSRRSEVISRFSAYVSTFPAYASSYPKKLVGEFVKAGEGLVVLESPELLAAQKEIIVGLQVLGNAHIDANLAIDRLISLGMLESDAQNVVKNKKVIEKIIVRSPQNGTILESNVREGARIEAGQVMFVVGDLKKNYIVGKIFQQDMPFVKTGQKVEIIIPGMEQKRCFGKVDLVYPNVSEGASTANVRIIPSEPLPLVQTGNYVQIQITATWTTNTMIPSEAILYSGQHAYVFVDKGNGNLQPTEVVMGRKTATQIEILEGLQSGQKIVESGTFLLSSEANLRSALPKWKTKGNKE